MAEVNAGGAQDAAEAGEAQTNTAATAAPADGTSPAEEVPVTAAEPPQTQQPPESDTAATASAAPTEPAKVNLGTSQQTDPVDPPSSDVEMQPKSNQVAPQPLTGGVTAPGVEEEEVSNANVFVSLRSSL